MTGQRIRTGQRFLQVVLVAIAAVPLLSPAAVDYRLVKIKKGEPLRTSLDEAVEAELARMREHYTWSEVDEQRNRENIRTRLKNESEGYRMEGALTVDYSKDGSVVAVTVANLSDLASSDITTEVFDGKITLRYWKRMRNPTLYAGDEREQFCRLADMIVLGDHLPSDAEVTATVQRERVTTTRYIWRRGRGEPYYTEVDRALSDGRLVAARSYGWGPKLGTPEVTYLVKEWTEESRTLVPKVIEIQSGPKEMGIVFVVTREKSGPPASTNLSKHLRVGERVIDVRAGRDRQTNFAWLGVLPPISGGGAHNESPSFAPSLIGLFGSVSGLLIGIKLTANLRSR